VAQPMEPRGVAIHLGAVGTEAGTIPEVELPLSRTIRSDGSEISITRIQRRRRYWVAGLAAWFRRSDPRRCGIPEVLSDAPARPSKHRPCEQVIDLVRRCECDRPDGHHFPIEVARVGGLLISLKLTPPGRR